LLKTPIPGTEWLRVKTTEGNIFYSHKVKKQSVWVVPDEIKDAVEAFENAEEHENAQAKQQEQAKEKEVQKLSFDEEQELKRLKAEIHGIVKRKAEEPQPLDEVVISKKARVEEDEDDSENSDEDEEKEEESEGVEEEWQREAAAQLAAEAEEEKKKKLEEEAKVAKESEESEAKQERSQLNMPDRVDLSIEEAKALFKVCYWFYETTPWLTCVLNRHYSGKSILILCTLGILRYPCSSQTRAMFFSHPFQPVVTHSMNTVEIAHAKFDNKISRKKGQKQTLRKSMTDSLVRKSRAREHLGLTFDELGRRTDDFTDGEETTESERRGSRNISRNLERVRIS